VTAPEFDTLRANLTRAQTQLRTETQNRRGFKLKAAVREVDAAATALVDAQNVEIVRLRMIASQQYAAGYRRARAFSTD
jgi:hypothetical protein